MKCLIRYLFSLYVILLSVSSLNAQEGYSFRSYVMTDSLDSKAEYDFVTHLNKQQNKALNRRSKFRYQLDSIFDLRPNHDPFDRECLYSQAQFIYDSINKREIYFVEQCDREWPLELRPWLFNVFHYSNNDRLKIQTSNYWYEGLSTKWDESRAHARREYFYNEKGLLEKVEDLPELTCYYYDSLDRLERLSSFQGDTTNLTDERYYKYTADGQLESISWYTDDVTRGWEPYDSLHYVYDNNMHRIEETRHYWSGYWEPQMLTKYTYNDDGTIYDKKFYKTFWEGDWITEEQSIHKYNNDGSIDELIVYDIADGKTPEPILEITYKYDFQVRMDEVRLPWFFRRGNDPSPANPLLLSIKSINEIRGTLINEDIYHYSSLDNSRTTESYNELVFKLSPNPATEHIRLSYDPSLGTVDLQLYNSQGILVRKAQLLAEETIDVSWLERGVYYYMIKGKTVSGAGRFVKI